MRFNGEKIHQLRWQQRLSLKQVAALMNSACTPMAINNWERGKSTPDASNLGLLAAALGVEVGFFFEDGY
jgi:transcriptional regulator with XRE-family HTH domain